MTWCNFIILIPQFCAFFLARRKQKQILVGKLLSLCVHLIILWNEQKNFLEKTESRIFFLDSLFFLPPGKRYGFWVRPRNVTNITEKHFYKIIQTNIKKVCQRRNSDWKVRKAPLFFHEMLPNFQGTPLTGVIFLRNTSVSTFLFRRPAVIVN